MKKTYFTILTLLTISYPHAALPEKAPLVSLEANQKENGIIVSIQSARSATPTESDAGSVGVTASVAGSVTSRFTTVSTNNRYQLPTSEQLQTASQITKAFVELRKEYFNLLGKMQRKDGRINAYLSEQIKTLRSIPEVVECAEAGERKDKTLESAIHTLIRMYRTLEGVANSEVTSATSGVETATNRTAELEETIASLTTSMTELQTLMETMAPKPTVHIETDMSPERIKQYREDDATNTDTFARLERTNKDQLDALTKLEATLEQREAKIASLTAVMQTVNAETLNLRAELAAEKKRADTAEAKARQRAAAAGGSERDRLLESGDSINGGSQRQNNQSCPCVVM